MALPNTQVAQGCCTWLEAELLKKEFVKLLLTFIILIAPTACKITAATTEL